MAATPWVSHAAGNWAPSTAQITAAGFVLISGSTRFYSHAAYPGVAFFKGTKWRRANAATRCTCP